MSEKRYFKVEYDEEWYLFDSTTISKQLVKEQAEYGYGVFANSLSPSEVVDLLNELFEENEQLRQSVEYWQKKYEEGTETFTLATNCDECDFLGNNGICGYCKFTLNCYDSKEDLIDGEILPNCPLKPLINVLNEQQAIIDEQNQRIRKLEDILEKFQFPVERV